MALWEGGVTEEARSKGSQALWSTEPRPMLGLVVLCKVRATANPAMSPTILVH